MASEDFELGELKEVRSFNKDNTAGELLEILNVHTRGIRHVAKLVEKGERTAAELATLQERMTAAMDEKIRSLPQTRMEWEPGGDEAGVMRAYSKEDGTLQLTTEDVTIPMPEGQSIRERSFGFLTDPRPLTHQQRDLQRKYLAFAMSYRMQTVRRKAPWASKMVQRAYREFYQACQRYPGEVGRRLVGMLQRAMSGATNAGAEWVLSPQLDTLIRPYDLTSNFVGRIMRRAAPGKTFDRPTVSGEILFRRAGNVTNDNPAAYATSSVTTSSTTSSIKDFAGRMVVDKFWMEDMADLVDPAELIAQIRRGAGRTLENALINGDTAGTHQDTALDTWTQGGKFAAGVLGGSDSPLKQILGLRALAADLSNTNDCGQTFSASVAFASLERLGARANSENLGWLTNLHVLHTQIMPNSNFLTVDKIGNNMATILTGTMGMMLGKPVDVTEFLTNDLDATTALYDGSGDATSGLLLVDYSAFDLWILQELMEFEVTEEHKGAVHLGATMRLGFDRNCLSTEKPVSLDFDL